MRLGCSDGGMIRAVLLVVSWMAIAACSGESAIPSTPEQMSRSGSTTQADRATTDPQETAGAATSSVRRTVGGPILPTSSAAEGLTSARTESAGEPAGGCAIPEVAPPFDGDVVALVEVGSVGGAIVRAGEYPLPDDLGDPWSQWGEGVVLGDGRFVSAVGDHRGVDGRTWFYEYDPDSGELVRTVEVSEFLGHEPGDWGYGKIHAPMLLDECQRIVTATYWGSRRGLVYGGSYSGDHLVRYDPWTREVTSLGVPVENHGVPSLGSSPDGRWVFGEAVDPTSEPDAGVMFVADTSTGEVVHVDDRSEHVGFRDVLVTPAGDAMFAAGGGALGIVRPDGTERTLHPGLPGAWVRSATPTRSDWPMYGATRDPDALFALDADESVTEMGELEGYVASLALSPDGSTLYYVPGAHGNGIEIGGTPLIAVDTSSGVRTTVARLNDLIEPALGLRVGGTYNVVADPSGGRVYVGLNAGGADDESNFGHVVLAVVELP